MAFSPIELPIQEILLTNFVTDIATISNANDLILKDKIEDVVNQLEIDTISLSIGTDNPINYVKAQSFIIQDTGLLFQTGTPTQVIARLEKNNVSQSVLTVDNLNVNQSSDFNGVTVNTVTVNDQLTADGQTTLNSGLEYKSSIIESKETVTLPLVKSIVPGEAEAFITLTSTSKRHIFVKLNAVTAPALNFVYDGVSSFAVSSFVLKINFDANNPPLPNTKFTIHLVDIREDVTFSSILSTVNTQTIDTVIRGGVNQSITPLPTQVFLHNGGIFNLGINMTGANIASTALLSNSHSQYGHSLTLLYIIDENSNDRLIIENFVGLEFF